MMSDKQLYRSFCEQEIHIPLFSQPWWLDIVAGEFNWDVIIIKREGHIVCSFPYCKVKQRYGFHGIGMPKLTPTLGPYIIYPPNQRNEARLEYEKEIIWEIISRLPKYDYFSMNFNESVINWLPWYWKGYVQTTRYTFTIDRSVTVEELVKNFSKFNKQIYNKMRRDVKNISIVDDLSPEIFYETCQKTFTRQNIQIPYSYELFLKIYNETRVRNLGKPYFAIDESGRVHAVSYEVWDNDTMYDLLAGGDPALRSEGERNMMLIHALLTAKEMNLNFDFEGSMIPSINDFYRRFGGRLTPYYKITKEMSKSYRLYKNTRNMVKVLLR